MTVKQAIEVLMTLPMDAILVVDAVPKAMAGGCVFKESNMTIFFGADVGKDGVSLFKDEQGEKTCVVFESSLVVGRKG